ncbi:DUF1059 domain-containing protein [Nocardioides sp. NPDC057767]|uniref:DUF1059 domain-containing protein n=1 Tax=unclassified Nocardioides TaxID=2615069 RepID=UPI003328AE83
MPLELACDACDVVLTADTDDELAELATRHARSIHGSTPPRDHVFARIHLQNR